MAHLFSQYNYIRNSTIMNAHLHMAENLTIKNSPVKLEKDTHFIE